MSIIRQIPWTRQPERATRVSREALSAFGVVGGFVVGPDWPPRRLVDGREFANVAAQATPVPVPAYFGLGARVTDAGAARYYTMPTGSFSSRNFTFLTRVRGSDFGASGVAMRLLPFGSGTSIFIWRNGTTFDMRINGTDYTGAGTFNLNQWYDIEIVGEAAACTLYVDGATVISGTAAAAGTINGDVSFYDVATTGQTTDYGYTLFCDRALTAGERASLRTNPWQLFAPRLQRIWLPAASSGAYSITAQPGAYTVTGQSSTITRSRLLTASAGSYTLSGQSATLARSRLIVASAGAYTYTGQSATVTYTAAGAYTLTALAGSYALSGQSATLTKSRVINASAGSYSLTGRSATITYSGAPAPGGLSGVYFDVLSGRLLVLRART